MLHRAYLEYKITGQESTGDWQTYLADAEPEPPYWFRQNELGYGQGQFPSIEHTLTHLKEINKTNRKILLGPQGNPKKPPKKTNAQKRHAKILRNLERLGIALVKE